MSNKIIKILIKVDEKRNQVLANQIGYPEPLVEKLLRSLAQKSEAEVEKILNYMVKETKERRNLEK